MDRPVPPEPSEYPRIKSAIRAARFMKWGATPIAGVFLIIAIIVGGVRVWSLGLAVLMLSWGTLFIFGYAFARCPRCGQVWWSGMSSIAVVGGWFALAENAAQEDETESYVCRRCRLNIGLALREWGRGR